ncbi:MAG: hypothetical protein E6300_16625 [Clostridium sp.]|uniref:hypothetical protein n=1 Tax=Clostridium sp. TaxID=1506 RepID=UPI0029110360|nr:hypothetical protein [Clostridium sp.]MDU7150102.1 hypothetical protein [Clostridium sp.]
MVNVYNDCNKIIGRVSYSENLDYFYNGNFQNGGVGLHKGLAKLKNGKYVLIYGSNWQGDRDYAKVISKTDALDEILESENLSLLDEPRFKELKDLYDSLYSDCEEL